jgi:hypothetical protein
MDKVGKRFDWLLLHSDDQEQQYLSLVRTTRHGTLLALKALGFWHENTNSHRSELADRSEHLWWNAVPASLPLPQIDVPT